MSLACLCKNVVGMTDGIRTYFYSIELGRLRPLDLKIYGVASKCSYSGRFLGALSGRGVHVYDAYNNVIYQFPNAIDISTYRESFVVGYLNKVEVWSHGTLRRFDLEGTLFDLGLYKDKVYVCEDGLLQQFDENTTLTKRVRCQLLAPLENGLVIFYGKYYKILSYNGMEIVGEGEVGCVPVQLDYSENEVLLIDGNRLCLYTLIQVREAEVIEMLSLIALGSIVLVTIKGILKYKLRPEVY